MTCNEARLLIGAHGDNELDDHLGDCAACRAEAAELRQLKEAARARLTRFEPSPAFIDRLHGSLRPPSRRRPAWLLAGSAAIAAALAVVFLVVVPRDPGRGRLGAEVLDAHARSLLADHLTDV